VYKKAIQIIVVLSVIAPAAVCAADLVDFGSFESKVTGYKEINSFTSEKGDVIKPSRRDAKFVEVTIEITATAGGEFVLYPAMFSALCSYRGTAKAIPARALGTKIKDRSTGKVTEYWYHEPEVSVILGVKAGETFRKYLVVEVPKEVDEFLVQGPKVIPAPK
jgi:hypothetical protein